MNKTNFKKVFSVFLSVLMILSCWVWVAPDEHNHIHANAATITGTDSTTLTPVDNVTIGVPETIYLDPSTSSSTTAQYFVNNVVDQSGNVSLKTDVANTQGSISIYAPGMTAFSLNVTTPNNSGNDFVLTADGAAAEGARFRIADFGNGGDNFSYVANKHITYNLLDGSLSSGLSAGSSALVEWEVTIYFGDNDTTGKTYYAYSTLYAPYYLPVGAATHADADNHDPHASSILWVSGVHSSGAGTYTVNSDNFLPMLGKITTPNNNDLTNTWIKSGSGTISFMSISHDGASSSYYHVRANSISPTANLTVDTSRYDNLKNIPNFKIGFMITNQSGTTGDDCAWYISDYTGKTTSYSSGTAHSSSQYTDHFNDKGTVIKETTSGRGMGAPVYNGTWDKGITGSASLRLKGAVKSMYSAWITTTAWNNNHVDISVTGVDKAALRAEVLKGTSFAKENYTEVSWNAYLTELRSAALRLGNPTGSDTATTNLTNKMNALQTTATLNFNYDGCPENVSVLYTVGAAGTYNYNVADYSHNRAGYTFKGWATSADAKSGSTSTVNAGLMPTFYATWEANTYGLTFDNIFNIDQFGTNKTVLTASRPEFVTVTYDDAAKVITLTGDGSKITDEYANSFQSEGYVCDVYTSYGANGYTMAVKPNTQYYMFYDWESNGTDVDGNPANGHQSYVFFYKEDGSGCANPHQSMGGSGKIFTTGADTAKIQIRLGTSNARNFVAKFSNIRIIEVDKYIEGISSHNPQAVTYDSTYGTLPTPTRDGYHFLKWVDANGNETVKTGETVNITENTPLYSTWEQCDTYESIPAVAATCTETGLTEGKKCSVCKAVTVAQTETPALGHTEGKTTYETTKEATCSETGIQTATTKCSVCGDTIKTVETEIPLKAHTWKDATCTEAKTCTVCGATEGEALGHDYKATVTPPTCTSKGYTTYDCSRCDSSYVENETALAPHTEATREENRVEATCETDGSYDLVKYCSVCKAVINTEAKTIEATGHNYDAGVETTPATCTTDGVKTFTCQNDNKHTYTEKINKLGHTEEEIPAVAATCEKTGLTAGVKCSVCDETLTAQETVPALGHDWTEWKTTKEPTCTEDGEQQQTCNNGCGGINSTTIDATGHDWNDTTYNFAADGSSCTAQIVCNNDAEHVETATATISSAVKTPATCEEKGTTTYTATFDVAWAEEQNLDVQDIDAINHAWTVSYAWTDDYSACTATRACGNDADHNVTATATIASEVTTPATCTEKGTTKYTATFDVDWATEQTEEVEDLGMLGHSWTVTYEWSEDNTSYTATRVCSTDPTHTETVSATVTSEVTTEPTCTEKGWTTYTATFAEGSWAENTAKTVKDIDALEHDWAETTYNFAADGKSCTAERVCNNDAEHV